MLSAVSGTSGVSGVSGVSGDDEPTPAPTPAPTPTPTPPPVLGTETVITGTVTMKVADPAAFCANVTALQGFATGMASLSESLDAAWVTVDCEVSSSRRLSETSRRLEGAVIMSYTITIPSTAPASAVTTIESMIEDATPTTFKNALNA